MAASTLTIDNIDQEWKDFKKCFAIGLTFFIFALILKTLYFIDFYKLATTGKQQESFLLSLLSSMPDWTMGVLFLITLIYYGYGTFSYSKMIGVSTFKSLGYCFLLYAPFWITSPIIIYQINVQRNKPPNELLSVSIFGYIVYVISHLFICLVYYKIKDKTFSRKDELTIMTSEVNQPPEQNSIETVKKNSPIKIAFIVIAVLVIAFIWRNSWIEKAKDKKKFAEMVQNIENAKIQVAPLCELLKENSKELMKNKAIKQLNEECLQNNAHMADVLWEVEGIQPEQYTERIMSKCSNKQGRPFVACYRRETNF